MESSITAGLCKKLVPQRVTTIPHANQKTKTRGIVMGKLVYKSAKWEIAIAALKKASKTIPGGNAGLYNLEYTVEKFESSPEQDFIDLYYKLSGIYHSIATSTYLCEPNSTTVYDSIFQSGLSFLIADTLLANHYPTNRTVFNGLPILRQEAKYCLIATNQDDLAYLKNGTDIISYTLTGQYEKAKKLLDKVAASTNWQGHLVDYCYMKEIYTGLFQKDTKGFNKALAHRIQKYRKNMVGYFPIIDIVSIALIQMAKAQGIECTVAAIEIPSFFVDGTYQMNRNMVAANIPFYEDAIKLLEKNGGGIL